MTKSVKLTRIPRSGLGNQLFSLNALLQVANELGMRPIRPLSVSLEALSMVRERLSMPNMAEAVGELLPQGDSVSSLDFDYRKIETSKNLTLAAPYLGESFFNLTKRDPLEFLAPPKGPGWSHGIRYIAVHMRGGDFAKWNPKAILPTDYYLEAIEAALDLVGRGSALYISTDDRSLKSWHVVTEKYSERLVPHLDSGGPSRARALRDFGSLAGADLIVSSPSTFAIWASILGSKRAIHSRAWVESRAELGDRFWADVATTSNPFYRVESLV